MNNNKTRNIGARPCTADMVAAYDNGRADYPPEMIDYLRAKNIGPDSIVADIGCGTGLLSRALIHLGCHILAIDGSAEMLDLAQRNLGNYPKIKFLHKNMKETGIADATLDMALYGSAIHWGFDDPEKTLGELARILKPGGDAVILSNPPILSGRGSIDTYASALCDAGFASGVFDHPQTFDLPRFMDLRFSSFRQSGDQAARDEFAVIFQNQYKRPFDPTKDTDKKIEVPHKISVYWGRRESVVTLLNAVRSGDVELTNPLL